MAARSVASIKRAERVRSGIEIAVVVTGIVGALAFLVFGFWASSLAGVHRTPDATLGYIVPIHAGGRSNATITLGYITPMVAQIYRQSWLALFVGLAVFTTAMVSLRSWKASLQEARDTFEKNAGAPSFDINSN